MRATASLLREGVGNPERLLDWLVCGGTVAREVVLVDTGGGATLELTADWVGSEANAAKWP